MKTEEIWSGPNKRKDTLSITISIPLTVLSVKISKEQRIKG